MNSFIDMCILCGCDYTSTIHGVGPCTAFKWITEHGSLENAIKNMNTDVMSYSPDDLKEEIQTCISLIKKGCAVDPESAAAGRKLIPTEKCLLCRSVVFLQGRINRCAPADR